MLSVDPVTTAIERFAPSSLAPDAARFARRVVQRVAPEKLERAKALLFAAGRLATFARSIGLDLDETVLLRDSLIERFACSSSAGSRATARTLRANLRFLAREVPAHRLPRPQPLPRDRAKPPYSPAELACYLALADAQPTPLRRARAAALICLGAGAGLIGGELRRVRGSDVVCRSGGVVVVVSGRSARAVPVLRSFHEPLCEAARFFGPAYLVSGVNPDSHNVTNPLIRSLSGGIDLARLSTSRLRSSYLVATAEQIGLRAFMDAAGITCTQRLGDLVAGLGAPSEEEAVALLSGRGA